MAEATRSAWCLVVRFCLRRLPGLLPQHLRQLVGVRIQLARAVRDVELWFNGVRTRVFADCVPRQTCASGYLSDREMISIMPTSDDAQPTPCRSLRCPLPRSRGRVRTWVSSRSKNPGRSGRLSVEINTLLNCGSSIRTSPFRPGLAYTGATIRPSTRNISGSSRACAKRACRRGRRRRIEPARPHDCAGGEAVEDPFRVESRRTVRTRSPVSGGVG